MTLPIDPTQIDPTISVRKQTTLEMDHDDAIEHVRQVFSDAGSASPSNSLRRNCSTRRSMPTATLLRPGACNPAVADRAPGGRPTENSARSSRVTSSSGKKNPVDSASTTSRSCGSRDSSEWHRTMTRWRTSWRRRANLSTLRSRICSHGTPPRSMRRGLTSESVSWLETIRYFPL